MSRAIKNVLVIGMGKVGSLVALLLQEGKFSATGMERNPEDAVNTVKIIPGDASNVAYLTENLKNFDAVIACLPYHLNINVAKAAYKTGTHYFDLTEDVETMEEIKKMAKTSKGVMAPQCGLAPGFIAIAGAHIANSLDKLRSIELRVGALPQHPKGLLGYALNWSAEGVVNEYLNDCTLIKDGKIKNVPAMQDIETIVIEGKKLEAFTTSGGVGTMCESFKGKVNQLNYKTLRYPGHCKMMRFLFSEMLLGEDRKRAGEMLLYAKPPVDEDVVYIHAAAEGWKNKKLERKEFVRAYYPKQIGKETWRAISWTTAASVCAVVELVATGKLPSKGFIKQEEISLDDFLKTKTGSFFKK